MKRNKKATKSRTSPKGGKRGCLCPDGKTYSDLIKQDDTF